MKVKEKFEAKITHQQSEPQSKIEALTKRQEEVLDSLQQAKPTSKLLLSCLLKSKCSSLTPIKSIQTLK